MTSRWEEIEEYREITSGKQKTNNIFG